MANNEHGSPWRSLPNERREVHATERARRSRPVGLTVRPLLVGELQPRRCADIEAPGSATAADTALHDKAQPVRSLTVDDSMLNLACHQLGRDFDALLRQAPVVVAGQDPVGVHRMRTSSRRIRAALRLFERLFPSRSVRKFRREFRWLAQVLGEVRDLDVYRENLRRYAADMPPENVEHLAPYRQHLDHEYAGARAELLRALGSDRYAQLLAAFNSFLDAASSPTALRRRGKLRIADEAATYVDRAAKRVHKCARRIDRRSSPRTLHGLRIRCKRLRYLLEFLEPAYGGRLQRSIKVVKRLQDTLGEHQDACVASERLRAFAESVPAANGNAGTLLALRELAQIQAQHAADTRKRFGRERIRFERDVSRSKLRKLLNSPRADRRLRRTGPRD